MKKITSLLFLLPFLGFSQTDGTLDTSFGTAGRVYTNPNTSTQFSEHGIQLPDGSIISGGYSSESTLDYMMVKYLPNGQPDLTWGTNGIVLQEFGQGYSRIKRMELQSDGKIIAAGRGNDSGTFTSYAQIARFNANGTLDTTFGTNGRVVKYGGSESDVYGLHVLPDNSIIAIGYVLNNNSDIQVIKLTPDGAYDTAFGTNGVAIINFGSFPQRAFCSAMNGSKILIGGVVSIPRENMLLLQLNENGSIDTTFGTSGGYTATSFRDTPTFSDYDRGFALTVSGGKIYQAGYREITSNNYNINLAKYNIDGTLDTTFSDDGKLLIDGPGQRDFVNDIKILNDQSILMAGHSIINNNQLRFMLLKLDPDGSFATGFGTGGAVITPMSGSSTINTIIVNEDNIIAVGSANTGTDSSFAMAKYHYANPLFVPAVNTETKIAAIYPNPVGIAATLSFYANGGTTQVTMYDNQGRLLKTTAYTFAGSGKQNIPVDTASLSAGIYHIKISRADGSSRTLKFLK